MSGSVGSYIFSFEKFISLKIIKFVYFLGLVVIVVGAAGGLIQGCGAMDNPYARETGTVLILASLVGLVFSFLVWRVICEGAIVFFSMHERLGDIREALHAKSSRSE